jgi:ketosteroid isomerase-like protein
MKSVNVILLTGMVIISYALLAQTKEMPFTSVDDLTKAKLKYPPPTDQDKQEIENTIKGISAAYLKSDIHTILSYYSDQALEIYPSQLVNVGTGNIRNRLKGSFSNGSFTKMDRTVESIQGAGYVAVAWIKTISAYKANWDGKTYEDNRHDIFLFRKQEDGKWKILVNHWFSTLAPSGQPSADSVGVRQLINNWSFFAKPGQILTQEHVDKYAANFSPQAVEILPNQWSNISQVNIRQRNTGAIGMTWAQCTDYTFDVNTFLPIGPKGFSRKAIAWGVGDHSGYGKGSDKLSQALFSWAMILTKEKDDQWRILMYHFCFD